MFCKELNFNGGEKMNLDMSNFFYTGGAVRAGLNCMICGLHRSDNFRKSIRPYNSFFVKMGQQ